ncbi:hypothetical protein CT43_P281056 (plasmid) [Bacillus thuringiensis serovar chinensis CT-43]|nr:hypothetical protein CT43_P281056 [Bacillus thuringiensis serovar chinensis CT-43]
MFKNNFLHKEKTLLYECLSDILLVGAAILIPIGNKKV